MSHVAENFLSLLEALPGNVYYKFPIFWILAHWLLILSVGRINMYTCIPLYRVFSKTSCIRYRSEIRLVLLARYDLASAFQEL